MRTYGQYCSAAKALDLVGDRWTLLVVRELLIQQGPCRFTELLRGLPGIATNLLTDRLRLLEAAGLVTRRHEPPPIATTLYDLTPRGQALEPVLLELMRWGMPLMAEEMSGAAFRAEWAVYVARLFCTDHAPTAGSELAEFRADGEVWYLEADHGRLSCVVGAPATTNVTVTGEARTLMGLTTGVLTLDQARDLGLELEGDPEVLARVLGPGVRTSAAPAAAPDSLQPT